MQREAEIKLYKISTVFHSKPSRYRSRFFLHKSTRNKAPNCVNRAEKSIEDVAEIQQPIEEFAQRDE